MAIRPYYVREDLRTGEVLLGLDRFDMAKIRAGYACAHCGEDFTEPFYGGKWIVFSPCPVCKESTSPADIVETPREWLPDPTDPYRS